MREVLPEIYEFTVVGGSMVFDVASSSVILVEQDGTERKFPYPVNVHAFCVVIGGFLYGREVGRKALFKIGKPGERKVIELRLVPVRKKAKVSVAEGEGEASPQNNGEPPAEKPQYRGALITLIDEKENFKRSFLFNRANLYALWEMFREQDRIVSVKDFVFEKRGGGVFLQGVYVPYQKAKASFYVLDTFLRTGNMLRVNQEWEEGKIMFWSKKNRMDFFRKNGDDLIPAGAVKLSFEDALRILSVL